MAVYETERDRIVLRVVYDGPGLVGKTTNVQQLAEAFRGEYIADPPEPEPADASQPVDERTRYFDWFAFDGGKLDGHNLRIQVISVPGHKRFEARRARLLRSADAIVLVCESALAGQESAREILDSMREHLGALASQVPIVVQANKQDLAQALPPGDLGSALSLPLEVPVIGAQASAGIGVRETAVQAVRTAVRRIKRQITRSGIASMAGTAGDADMLRAELERLASSAKPEVAPQESLLARRRMAQRLTIVSEPKVVQIRPPKTGKFSTYVPSAEPPEVPRSTEPGSETSRPPVVRDTYEVAPRPGLFYDEDTPQRPTPEYRRPDPPPPPPPRTTASEVVRPPPPRNRDAARPPSDAAPAQRTGAVTLADVADATGEGAVRVAGQRTGAVTLADVAGPPSDAELAPAALHTLVEQATTPSAPAPVLPRPVASAPPEPDPLAAPARRPGPFAPSVGPTDPASTKSLFASPRRGGPTSGPPPPPAAPKPAATELLRNKLGRTDRLPPPPPVSEPGKPAAPPPTAATSLPRTASDDPLPALPRPNVPTGHVWPIPRGREVLRALVDVPIERLPAPPRASDSPVLLAAADWRLCTRDAQHYPSLALAHAALLERVRQTRLCTPLLARDLVLVIQPEFDESARLWHIVPRLDGIREHLALRPAQARPRLLAALAAAVVAALRLWLRHSVALELDLGAFAVEDGRVVHLGDRISDRQRDLGGALLSFCERLTGDAAALAAFTAALEQELVELTTEERVKLELEATLLRAETRYQDAHLARNRLLGALRTPT